MPIVMPPAASQERNPGDAFIEPPTPRVGRRPCGAQLCCEGYTGGTLAAARQVCAEVLGGLYTDSPASGSAIAGGSGTLRYGCSGSWSSSWYADSALTAQMSCWVPRSRLSTARIAVSIE